MAYEFSTLGALLGLATAIFLIIRKVHPVYSLLLGALLGGLVGGGGLNRTMEVMVAGAADMVSSVLRIMTSGVLAGALIMTGSAEKIAETITEKLGEKRALTAIAAAAMIIVAVGIFADIAVITVAPIAIAIGRKANLTVPGILLAMIGGGKAGNVLSPNPNTIAAAQIFDLDLMALIAENLVPAACTLLATILVANLLCKKETQKLTGMHKQQQDRQLPGVGAAFAGPMVVIGLLAMRPLFSVSIDPLIALPAGGMVCILATKNIKNVIAITEAGLQKVLGVSVVLLGTGTLAGIIKNSGLQYDVIAVMELLRMPTFLLAPLSGILMSAATASTTAGTTVASQTFGSLLVDAGIPAISAGAMIHAGATVLDSLPHGSFFHATGDSVGMSFHERLKLIPYEAFVALVGTGAAVLWYLF